MRRTGLLFSLGLASCLVGPVVMAGEHAGGADKLKLVGLADSPDPWSPASGDLSIQAAFEARPTDAGGGNAKNEKSFAIRVTVQVTGEAGGVVRELAGQITFQFPEMLPASRYHGVVAAVTWDGKDAAGTLVPDGTYTYTVRGDLARYDILGNGKVQEHLVGTSGTLSGTVVVDGSAPQLTVISPPDDSYTNDPKPLISGKAVDPTSGIDATTVVLTVDENAVDASYDPATGLVSYTPAEDLPQKWIDVLLQAKDLAGNAASITWSFCEDRASPAATIVSPAADSWVTVPRPEIGADVVDPLAGVDPATVTMQVLGAEAPASYNTETGRLSYTPEVDLPEAEEVDVVVDAADRAGNPVQLAWTFGSDRTPPVISEAAPADGSWVNDALVHVSASYSDPTSGVVVSSARLIVGGDDVTPIAEVTEEGVEYAPYDPFGERLVTVSLSVSDKAGHEATEDWSFSVDTIAPVISDLAFSRTPTNDPQEPASAAFSDVGGGVDVEAVVILLDGKDVTYAADVRTDGFDLVPPVPLVEGNHELEVHIADLAGNEKTGQCSVEVDLTLPPAPVVEEVIRTTTRVTLKGPSPEGVVHVEAWADKAELVSAVLNSFTVVFDKIESETFTYRLWFVDAAGNIGPETQGDEYFTPEVVPVEVTLALLNGYQTGTWDGVALTNHRPFVVCGGLEGIAPFQVTVKAVDEGGVEHTFPAVVVADQFTSDIDLPDGHYALTAEATDSTGASAVSEALQVVADTVPPEVTITQPAYKTTVGCDFLWLNASGNDCAADEEWPVDVSKRNVFARAGFTVRGAAADSRLPIEAAWIQTRKDGQVLASWPATIFTSNPADGGWEATFSFLNCALAVKPTQLHQLVVVVKDAAGNETESAIAVKYDNVLPGAYIVEDGEWKDLRSSPVRFIRVDWDAVTVACKGAEWMRWSPSSDRWYSSDGVASEPEASVGSVFSLEDRAGNTNDVGLLFDIDPIMFYYDMEVFRAGNEVWNRWDPGAPPMTVDEGEVWPSENVPFALSGWRLDAVTRWPWVPDPDATVWPKALYQLPRSDEASRVLEPEKTRVSAEGFFPAAEENTWINWQHGWFYNAEASVSAGPGTAYVHWWDLPPIMVEEGPASNPRPDWAQLSHSIISMTPPSITISSSWPPGLWPGEAEVKLDFYNAETTHMVYAGYVAREHGQAITLRVSPDHVPAEKTTLFIEGWFGKDVAGQEADVVFIKCGCADIVYPTSTRVVYTDFARRHVTQAILCDVDFTEPAGADYKGIWNVFVRCGRVHTDSNYKKLKEAIVVVEGEGTAPGEEPPPFALDVPARCCVVINDVTGIGTSKITLRPYIPELTFEFEMFDCAATFAGGATSLTANSSDFTPVPDPDTGETVGRFEYDIEMPPWEDQYCFNIEVFDGGEMVGEEFGVNGYPCKVEVPLFALSRLHECPRILRMNLRTNCPSCCRSEWTKHDLAIPEGPVFVLAEEKTVIDVLGRVRPGAFDCTTPPGLIPPEKIDEKYVMVDAEGVPEGRYDVKIGLTLFRAAINVGTAEFAYGRVVGGVFTAVRYLKVYHVETQDDVDRIAASREAVVAQFIAPNDGSRVDSFECTFYGSDAQGSLLGPGVPAQFWLVETTPTTCTYRTMKAIISADTTAMEGNRDKAIVVCTRGGGALRLRHPLPD